jgi:hypothetical protein
MRQSSDWDQIWSILIGGVYSTRESTTEHTVQATFVCGGRRRFCYSLTCKNSEQDGGQ